MPSNPLYVNANGNAVVTVLDPVTAAAPERDTPLSWDLIPDEGGPSGSIVMRFTSYQAAHTALTAAGYARIADSTPAARDSGGLQAVRYRHFDGSVVLLASPAGEADVRLALAAVGG